MSYDFWRARLAGDTSPATNEDPQPGFWRVKIGKGGPFVPLATFQSGVPRNEDRIVGWLGPEEGGRLIEGDELNSRWAWCNVHPLTEAVYRDVASGNDWPDQDASATASIGHNSNAVSDEEQIKSQIEAASAGVKDYTTITDADHFARSQSLRSRLLELTREAKKHREGLSKQHNEALKEIRAVWTPLVDGAQNGADAINKAQNDYNTRLIRERKAAEAKIAAEKSELEARGVRVPDLAPPPPLPTKVKGASGRAAHVGTKTVLKEVLDWGLLFSHFSSDEEIRSELCRLAQRALDRGEGVPGITTERVGRVK